MNGHWRSDIGAFLIAAAVATICAHFGFGFIEWSVVLIAVTLGVKLLHDSLVTALIRRADVRQLASENWARELQKH